MHKKQQRRLAITLSLITSLVIYGNSSLYAAPTRLTQSETEQLSEERVTASEPHLDPAVARALLEQIRTATDTIQDDGERAKALLKIAQSYDRLSDYAKAEEISSEVIKIVTETLETTAQTEHFLAGNILSEVGAFSNKAIVYDVFSQVLNLAGTIKDTTVKSSILDGIIRSGSDSLSDHSLMDDLSNQLLALISTMPDGLSKFHDTRQLAEIYHQRLDEAKAVELIHQSIDALAKLPNDSHKQINLNRLTQLVNSLADNAVDEELLVHFLSLADTMQDNEAHVWANSVVLAERTGHVSKVKDLLAESLRVANTTDNESERASLLATIANNYGLLSTQHHYQFFSTQLYEAANSLREPDDRHRVFTNIAKAAAASAYKSGNLETLEQTVAVANTLNDSRVKASILIAAASGYAQLSDQETAQVLLAQALSFVNIEHYAEDTYSLSYERIFSGFVRASKLLPEESQQQLLDRFLRLSDRIQDKNLKSDLLFSIAGKYGEGYEVNANRLLEGALSTVEALPDNASNTAAPVQMLKLMAYTPAENVDLVAEPAKTFDFLQRILPLIEGKEAKIVLAEDFWDLFPAVTIGLGNEAYSGELLAQLETMVTISNDPLANVYMSSAIARIYASLSNEEAAQNWLSHALVAGSQLDDDHDKLETLLFTAFTVTHWLSDGTAAADSLDDWLSIIADMQDYYRGEGLVTLAYGASRLSDEATAQSLVNDVIEITTATVNDDLSRTDVLGAMAWSVATMAIGEEVAE